MKKKLLFILLMSGVMLSPMTVYAMNDEDIGSRTVSPHTNIATGTRTEEGVDAKYGPYKQDITEPAAKVSEAEPGKTDR
jgi:hypothetical protein